jgi:hypothetical protein
LNLVPNMLFEMLMEGVAMGVLWRFVTKVDGKVHVALWLVIRTRRHFVAPLTLLG